jgi:hypothetical protein
MMTTSTSAVTETQLPPLEQDTLELRMGFRPDAPDFLLHAPESQTAYINIAPFPPLPPRLAHAEMAKVIDQARGLSATHNRRLVANTNPQFVNDDLLARLGDPRTDMRAIDQIRSLMTFYTVLVRDIKLALVPADDYPKFSLSKHPCLLRYGNVELRVIENYLRDKPALEAALERVTGMLDDETAMYLAGRPSNFLAADDMEWNIRTLMTNAGFYVAKRPEAAARVLEDWASRYISALRSAGLATFPPAYPFYFSIQRLIWEQHQEAPHYVQHPNVFEVYNQLAGARILFMSPLAHVVAEQVKSGQIRRLYKDYVVPDFTLETVPSWVSTWPNCPHSDWSETFRQMCNSVDAAYSDNPFDVFMSSCGCYGLPLSEYVRRRYGCAVIYLGNISNAYFGVRQTATRDFMKGQANPEAWAEGDLRRFPNVDRIDGGRYV